MSLDVAASIRSRLLNRAKSGGIEFQHYLVRYARERFLYRLGQSAVRDRLILKGGTLLSLWMPEPFRFTRDIDMLASEENNEEVIRDAIRIVCAVSCPEDGLEFDVDSLKLSPIREGQVYGGQRATLTALLSNAKATVRIDFGFGDAVSPEDAVMPTLIDSLPAPSLLVYPMVSVIAEKFQAMVHLGLSNTRMKDFHDVWALSESFNMDGDALLVAVADCFRRRGTPWTEEMPAALTPEFYTDANTQMEWERYVRSATLMKPPPASFEGVGHRVISLLGPIRESIMSKESFRMRWVPGDNCQTPHRKIVKDLLGPFQGQLVIHEDANSPTVGEWTDDRT